jgi:hypothetical protein
MNRKFLALAAIGMACAYSPPSAAQHAAEWKPRAIVVGDWVYGCRGKEKWSCEAITLPPENDVDGMYMLMKIRRYKESEGFLEFPGFTYSEPGEFKVSVDGKLVRPSLKFRNTYSETLEFDGSKALDALRLSILNGSKLQIDDSNGELIGYVSLKGSTVALSQLDKEQKEEGYTTAFVKRGKKKHVQELNPMAPPALARRAEKSALTRGDINKFAATVVCDNGQAVGTDHSAFNTQFYNKPRKAMLFVDCGTEGINRVAKAFTAEKRPNASEWSFEPATFYDYETGKDVPMSLLYNVEMGDVENFSSSRYLTSKDCGERIEFGQAYYSDTTKKSLFGISGAYEMPVCRGVTEWVAVN